MTLGRPAVAADAFSYLRPLLRAIELALDRQGRLMSVERGVSVERGALDRQGRLARSSGQEETPVETTLGWGAHRQEHRNRGGGGELPGHVASERVPAPRRN
eukprot:COSAG01_NODE_1809_length_9182_cov_6.406914_9_plen_102_part_00